jgi:hypothetical protein
VGPQDPKDVTRDTARDLSGLVGELAALKGDATHWLTDPEYEVLRYRLEAAHAAAEAALVEARRRVRLGEEREASEKPGRSGRGISEGVRLNNNQIVLPRSAGAHALNE